MEIIAHRGFCIQALENTPAAVLAAWKIGADAVEIDVRLSKDGTVVVIHDANTNGIRVSAADFEQLEKTGIASLKQILDVAAENKKVFIEIKCKSEIIHALKSEIQRCAKQRQVVLIGFDFQTMKQAKMNMPDICVCLSVKAKKSLTGKFKPYGGELIERACDNKFSGFALEYNSITADFTDMCKKSNLKIFAWTVNDTETAKFLADCRIAGIITDQPDLIRKAVEKE
ncbi:MAG: glycerophosphodiester phosphodiesterase [Sedimentisphaerales bacterium]|jgi:glycerophosphoryl diester phosphodiesterase